MYLLLQFSIFGSENFRAGLEDHFYVKLWYDFLFFLFVDF